MGGVAEGQDGPPVTPPVKIGVRGHLVITTSYEPGILKIGDAHLLKIYKKGIA
jgi:hypothetical protein